MWKYQCKRHLLYVLIAGIVGAFLFQINDYGLNLLKEVAQMMNMPEVAKLEYLTYVVGALTAAGLVNGLLLMNYFVMKFHITPLIIYVVIMFAFPIVSAVGELSLPIVVIVCIYGMLTVPNRKEQQELRKNKTNTVKEIERVYRLHHKYHEEYEELAKSVWYANIKATLSYVVGLLLVLAVMLAFNSFMLLLLSMMAFGMLYTFMSRQKAKSVQPVISLLYDQCDPEACASCIFALTHKFKKKNQFMLTQYLAQCMIYLNDPHLAADIMVTCERDSGVLKFPYYSVMAYVYYLLGDRNMVQYEYEQCEQSSASMNSPIAMIRNQCLLGIQNKLRLMDKNFDEAQRFYLELIQNSPFECQRVDCHYYLGLISFVHRDFSDARYHFEYVEEHGNGMYFVEKAKAFIQTITQVEV